MLFSLLRKAQPYFDFQGQIADGMGMYSELVFPKKDLIPDVHKEWPDEILTGSLNIRIAGDGFSPQFNAHAKGLGLHKLDTGKHPPAFQIPHTLIGNNMLRPHPSDTQRGTAQVWRAEVTDMRTHDRFNAWAVRRIGSAYSNVIELMSDIHLRTTHGLENGQEVNVRVFGGP